MKFSQTELFNPIQSKRRILHPWIFSGQEFPQRSLVLLLYKALATQLNKGMKVYSKSYKTLHPDDKNFNKPLTVSQLYMNEVSDEAI